MDVRDSTFEVMRGLGMTTLFGNPGSTEVAFLTDLPSDLNYVLGLHEGSVVGMASGYAIARQAPAFVNLHTAPGLGNAVNAIVNARDCRVSRIAGSWRTSRSSPVGRWSAWRANMRFGATCRSGPRTFREPLPGPITRR
jgi:hypothetical protein